MASLPVSEAILTTLRLWSRDLVRGAGRELSAVACLSLLFQGFKGPDPRFAELVRKVGLPQYRSLIDVEREGEVGMPRK
jgi:hypothetical protein